MRRDRDDYDDADRPRPRKKDNTLLYVLLAVGGLMLAGCGGVGALVLFGWTRAVQDRQQQPAIQVEQEKQFTREEFKKLVMGRTPEEVEQLIGKPDTTSEVGRVRAWRYRERTQDPVTGRVDSSVQVVFEIGPRYRGQLLTPLAP